MRHNQEFREVWVALYGWTIELQWEYDRNWDWRYGQGTDERIQVMGLGDGYEIYSVNSEEP